MASISSNAAKVAQTLNNNIKKLPEEIRKDLQKYGNSVVKLALRSRRYRRRNGALDRAHSVEVKGLTCRIYLDPAQITSHASSGKSYNYGLIQHDGSKYITGHPWLEESAEKQLPKLTEAIAKTVRRLT